MEQGLLTSHAVRYPGWSPTDDLDHVRHADSSEAYRDGGGRGLPVRELLCVRGDWAGRRVTFAVAVDNERYTPDAWFTRIVDSVLAAPAMITAGAVVPWLDRLRSETPVWVREAGRPWWPLGGGAGSRKVKGPDTATEPLVTSLLAALVAPPSAAAVTHAERMLATLRAAGWRDTTGRNSKPQPGLRVLAVATFRNPSGGRHRLAYVLTGDPSLPEALWWHPDAKSSDWSWESARWRSVLIDVTRAVGPALPVNGDPLAETLDVLVREVPGLLPGEQAHLALLEALTPVASVFRRDWRIADPLTFSSPLSRRFPRRPAPPSREAAAAVQANPEDGENWLLVGFAALQEKLTPLAATAFGRAAELGAGGGLPMLWRGWLCRRLDPAAALADLDRAAETGEVVGYARHTQAVICQDVLDDPDQMLVAYARAAAEDPAYRNGWVDHGLALAKHGRSVEAVRVFTEATALHPEVGYLWYCLGYAQLLVGERDAALLSLERAARLSPELVPEILRDEDLAPLRGDPRFEGWLREVATAEEAAAHRRARDAVRPATIPAEPSAGRATDLDAVLTMSGVRRCRISPGGLPEGVTEPRLRELLSDTGLPARVADFEADNKAYRDTLRPYQLGVYPDLSGDRLPVGLGGLYVLGRLDGEIAQGGYVRRAEVAVDGETGEIFRVAPDHTLSYLAPNLTAFLLPRCLREDEWVWRINPATQHRLDDVTGIGDGKLAILAEELDKSGQERLVEFLVAHGALLGRLRVERYALSTIDLSGVDFRLSCPNLRQMIICGGHVNESVFCHPVLEALSLDQSVYEGTVRHIRLDGGSALRNLSITDSVVHADTLTVGPGSPLRAFTHTLDEDYSEASPRRLTFEDCPELRSIYINATWNWQLILRGSLPRLESVDQDAGEYGSYTYRVENAIPADRKRYLSLIRKGRDFTKHW